MSIGFSILLILIGFLLLVKGADFFVEGAASIAKILNVPALIIGLTIVAFGTSAPELAVSVTSAIKHQNGLAVGNVVGSNIFNLLVVLGVSALIRPLSVQKDSLRKDFPFMLLITFALVVMGADRFLDPVCIDREQLKGYSGNLSRSDGILLILFFLIFVSLMVSAALKNRRRQTQSVDTAERLSLLDGEIPEEEKITVLPLWKSLLFAIGGLFGVILGGDLTVDNAVFLARTFHVSETVIGLTLVAIGTSLPELVTSAVAAKKKQSDIAVGNVLGSSIFNILLILGVSAIISPIPLEINLFFDILGLFIVSLLSFFFILNQKINRIEGGLFLLFYAGYMVYLFLR